MFLDFKGFTERIRSLEKTAGHQSAAEMKRKVAQYIEETFQCLDMVIKQVDYQLIDTAGDGFFYHFRKPSDVCSFVEELHRSTDKHNANVQDELAEHWFRVGAATGEAAWESGKPVGHVVNTASRLQAASTGGDLVIDRTTLEGLSPEVQQQFGGKESIRDKHDKTYEAYRNTFGRVASELTTPSFPATIPPITPQSDSQPIRIVPKGLRSFDAHDADFFLELLPGPRDRDGLPDSIRFWKTRIEEKDADTTFTVGLIYGPSGCGKSSLMKAGLLPRLSENVIAVYVEATAEETETRLLNGLRKRCAGLPANLGLKETLAALRRGQGIPVGKKVLIVLDQFEQWLHAKKDEEITELVQALRQCDGGRVQCIVMVRDDFWLAVSRFLRDLEVRLVEGQNSALVDLFPIRHAEKVLAAFGRAFSVLPENAADANHEQKQFLEQAVSGLAQEGKVICVRLALFAEMMKGKSWTPATLKEVGGTEGVGVTFLEETFSSKTAPPEHRYHQKAARGVLKALLPESGTDIKGHMQSHAELLEASGYANRPKDFDELIRILDSEIRLITPTDPEGKEGDSSAQVQAGAKYYQLTHDYLVPSLRDWLTRKQKETRRGRAELLLADRAAVWNARQENRQLPSLWQWASIRWLTQRKNWTPPQRKMMRKATRYHVVRAAVVGIVLALATITGLTIFERVEEKQKVTYAPGMVRVLLKGDTSLVPTLMGPMTEYRKWVDPLLYDEFDKAAANSRQKLHASLALLPVDPTQVDYLYGRLLDAEPHEVPVIRAFLEPHKDNLHPKLWRVVESPEKGKEPQRLRAAAALAKYDPESERWSKLAVLVVNDLVLENSMLLGQWAAAFKDVKHALLAPLSEIYRDHQPERAAERMLATNLLADYAADNPQVLADLLMDADEKQFAATFPKFKEQSEAGLPLLTGEIEKKPVIVKDKMIFEEKGMIALDDAKVKTPNGLLPAKRFEVRLQAGKQYRVTMDSKDLDSFLILQDKTGKVLAFDDDSGGGLNPLLLYTPLSDDSYIVFAAALQNQKETKNTGAFVLKIMATANPDENKEKLAKRQANAAVALLRKNQPEMVWLLLKHSPDPRVRSYVIHRFAPLGADAKAIVNRLDEESDITVQRELILSLGEYGEKNLSSDDQDRLTKKLQMIYSTAADPGLHAASEWLLRHWKHEAWLKQTDDEWANDGERREKRLEEIKRAVAKEKEKTPPQWYVNGQGQTMVVIPGPVEFVMGSPPTEAGRQEYEIQHQKRIGRTFALAAKSVTVEQYRKSNKRYQLPAIYTRTADLPVVATSWYQAAAYCNWLSEKEGIDKKEWCYEIKGQVTKLKENYLSLTGYRLPTEAEMEYATRAGALTSRYFGETEELLPRYAWYQKNSQNQTWPVGSLKPNDLGLFDMHGTVWTWCQESYKAYPAGKGDEAVEDKEDSLVANSTDDRVLRGGSFNYQASSLRSATRLYYGPTYRGYSYGFRVARTLPLGSITALPPDPRSKPVATTLLEKKESLTDKDSGWMPTNPKGDRLLKSVSGNPHKVYTLNLTKGDKLVIRLKSKDMKFDPLVALEDSKKNIIAYNDDEDYLNEILDSKLVVTIPKDGEYRIVATCSHEAIRNKYGHFHLTVEKTK